MKRLVGFGIKSVINLRDNDARAEGEEQEARAAGLNYFNVPLRKFGTPADAQVDDVLSLMSAPENQPVFVHCRRGSDRTGVVIAIYRIEREGWTGEQAKDEAKLRGMGFWHIPLKQYINDYYERRQQRSRVPAALKNMRAVRTR